MEGGWGIYIPEVPHRDFYSGGHRTYAFLYSLRVPNRRLFYRVPARTLAIASPLGGARASLPNLGDEWDIRSQNTEEEKKNISIQNACLQKALLGGGGMG